MRYFRLLIFTSFAFFGCAGAPTQELADARSAMIAAEEAHGKDTVGENLSVARKYLNHAEMQLELGNYSDAKAHALLARREATRARNIAVALEEAKRALARAQAVQASSAALEQAFNETLRAAQLKDEAQTIAMSGKTVILAVQNENRVLLQEAKVKLNECGDIAVTMHRSPDLWREAQMAISRDQGALALEYATTLCKR